MSLLCSNSVYVSIHWWPVQLADCSVAHRIILLTGFSPKNAPTHGTNPYTRRRRYYTTHGLENRLQGALQTLSVDLCSAGLVENGAMGELAARILLLVARDFAVPAGVLVRAPNLLLF